jgi:pyruvate/2-oxoglutarate dehydrogenase complex dihydrolipoamide dehydrogenase (E3) component
MKKEFDAIVIRSGQSGLFLAVRMAAAQRVAVIERHRFGGTCVNTGCIPTKTLVASAYNPHMGESSFSRRRLCGLKAAVEAG